MKEGIRDHFKDKFMEPDKTRPILEGISFRSLSIFDRSQLEVPFTKEKKEIRDAVWGCDKSKSPKPDNYNFFFIRKCWYFIKQDILKFVKKFHRTSKLNKSITYSFLTLIPKNLNPQGLEDLCHVCLVGCLQSNISKILAARIKRVLGSLISSY